MPDLLRSLRAQRVFVAALWLVGLLLDFPAPLNDGLPTQTVSLTGCAFIALTFFWDGKGMPPRHAWLVAAALLVSGTVIGVLLSDFGWWHAARIVSGSLVGGAAGTVCWAALRGTAQAPPRNTWTLLGLVLTTLVANAVGGLTGAWPGEGYWALLGPYGLLWTVRGAVFMLVVGLAFLPLRFGDLDRWRVAPPPRRFIIVGAVPVTLLCFAIAYLGSSLPLAWVILIPGLWVGLNVTPLWAGLHVLMMSSIAGAMRLLPFEPIGVEGVLLPSFVLDALLVEALLMVMLLALLRDERDQALADETRDKATYDSEAELLAEVFNSMADGVVIYDSSTGASTSNPAAKAILGRRRPTGDDTRAPDEGWSGYFGVRRLDGSPMDDSELQAALRSGPAAQLVRLEQQGGSRIVALRTSAVNNTNLALLLTDVTEKHAHLAELEKFAHTVAHDLRSPLGSLTGWVELALEEASEEHDDEIDTLLLGALASGDQMRQVIEQWLSQATAPQPH